MNKSLKIASKDLTKMKAVGTLLSLGLLIWGCTPMPTLETPVVAQPEPNPSIEILDASGEKIPAMISFTEAAIEAAQIGSVVDQLPETVHSMATWRIDPRSKMIEGSSNNEHLLMVMLSGEVSEPGQQAEVMVVGMENILIIDETGEVVGWVYGMSPGQVEKLTKDQYASIESFDKYALTITKDGDVDLRGFDGTNLSAPLWITKFEDEFQGKMNVTADENTNSIHTATLKVVPENWVELGNGFVSPEVIAMQEEIARTENFTLVPGGVGLVLDVRLPVGQTKTVNGLLVDPTGEIMYFEGEKGETGTLNLEAMKYWCCENGVG